MLTVTSAALERLSRKLARKKAADDMALRVRRSDGRWGLGLDHARPDDTTFEHNGRNVLLMDVAVSLAMTNGTLDVTTTKRGPRLKLRGTRGSK